MNLNTGAVYLSNSANIKVVGSTFKSCAAISGGGVFTAFGSLIIISVEDSSFQENQARDGAAIMEASISRVVKASFLNCKFERNFNARSLFVTLDTVLLIEDCFFFGKRCTCP